MAATTTGALSGASVRPLGGPQRGPERLVALLAGPDSPITVAEAAALVAAWLAPEPDVGERPRRARWCRCARSWEFSRGHCGACGHDIKRVKP